MFYKFKAKYNVTELFRFMFGKQDLQTTLSKMDNKCNEYMPERVDEEVKSKTRTTDWMIN